MKHFIITILLCIGIVPSVLAHGADSSFEKEIGNLLVDIGYDTPFSVTEDTLLDFAIYNMKGDEVTGLSDFTSVDVSFQSGAVTQWEKNITKPDFGKVFTTVTPKKPGNWMLHVVFSNEGNEIVSTDFPIFIEGSDLEDEGIPSKSVPMLFIGIALLLGISSYFIFLRK